MRQENLQKGFPMRQENLMSNFSVGQEYFSETGKFLEESPVRQENLELSFE